MPQIEINVSCENCDFVRTYWNEMPDQDDILEDFYHCANDNCFQEICVDCSKQCDSCQQVYCENCIDDKDVHECSVTNETIPENDNNQVSTE